MTSDSSQTLYAAPFTPDGELQGVGAWRLTSLSNRWIEFAQQVLRTGGSGFQGPLPAPFEYVSLRFTSASGAALATFSIRETIEASSVYLRGDNPEAETEILTKFVESLRRVELVRQLQSDKPFATLLELVQRPINIVVVWGTTSDDDSKMVAQLNTHFAAAYLFSPEFT